MFYSTHTEDSMFPLVEVSLVDKAEVSEFNDHPVMISLDKLTVYCRKNEAQKLHALLGYALQEMGI